MASRSVTPKLLSASAISLLAIATTGTLATVVSAAPAKARAVSSSTASCINTAKAHLKKAEAPKTFIPGAGSINVSSLKGKSIWIISLDTSIPFNEVEAQGASKAAKAAGLDPTVFDGASTVATENAGVEEAVGAHAAGIILQGVDPKLISGSIASAKAAGIPIIDSLTTTPTEPRFPGVDAHVTANYGLNGQEIADWVLADSHCAANTLLLYPSLHLEVVMADGFKYEYRHLCPSCKIDSQVFSLTTMATQLTTLVQETLRTDPGLDYVFPTFDDAVTFVLPATEHTKIKVVSHDGIPANLSYIRKGEQAEDDALPPLAVVGWVTVDRLMRAMLGKPTPVYVIPDRLVDQKNLPKSDSAIFGTFDNYGSILKKLWKH